MRFIHTFFVLLCWGFAISLIPQTTYAQTDNYNSIRITGSGTLYPLTKIVAHMYSISHKSTSIDVFDTGTSAGFKQFIEGKSMINNASRRIKAQELAKLKEAGIEVVQIPVAVDGISIVVSQSNSFIKRLTTTQLADIFRVDSPYQFWSDINPNWPQVAIDRIGPGTMHGTYDYFNSSILGKYPISTNYRGFKDYDDIASYIAENKYAIGYLGFANVVNHQKSLRAIAIDNGKGAILPNYHTISSETYKPLTRTLFLYVNKSAMNEPEIVSFIKYYLKHAKSFCPQAGFIPLTKKRYTQLAQEISIADPQRSALLLKSQP